VVAEAVAQGDISTVAGLVASGQATVSYARSAIQVAGCDGVGIYGHIPIASDFLTRVVVAVEEDRQ